MSALGPYGPAVQDQVRVVEAGFRAALAAEEARHNRAVEALWAARDDAMTVLRETQPPRAVIQPATLRGKPTWRVLVDDRPGHAHYTDKAVAERIRDAINAPGGLPRHWPS